MILAFSISFSAFGAWPCPSETSPILAVMSLSSANFLKSATGSEPGERTKIRGEILDESL